MTEIKPPQILVLPIVDECMAQCVMCGIWRRPKRPPLSIDLLAKVLSESYASSSLTHLNITGGEPTLHPDLLAITRLFGDRCASLQEINLSVSGLNPQRSVPILLEWMKAIPSKIQGIATLSLDGLETQHNAVRRVPNAFGQTIQTLKTLKEKISEFSNIRLHVNYTLSSHNANDALDLCELCRRENVGFTITLAAANDLYLSNQDRFDPQGDSPESFAQTIYGLSECGELAAADRIFLRMAATMLEGKPRPYCCPFQTQGAFWDLDGTCYPCGTCARLSYGRLGDESIEAMYTSHKADDVRQQLIQEICPTCFSNSYFGFIPEVWLNILKEKRKTHGRRTN